MTASVGDKVLDWMVRRLNQAVTLHHDLVLVHDHPALADVSPSVDVRAGLWRVARATGELTLRDILPEADRLIAIVPADFPPLPLDIAGRAYLGRVLDVRAEDVVAAVSGRFCEALADEAVVDAVFQSMDLLRTTAGRWSLGELVTAREVRSVLVAAELGAARLDRERDHEILARWILEGAPSFRAGSLVRAAIEDAHPRTGRWLAWALTDGSVEQLCAAGALLSTDAGAALAPAIPGLTVDDRPQLVDLVDAALRIVAASDRERASRVLVDAERAARSVALDSSRHRLLKVPLEGALTRAARLAAEGRPQDDGDIEAFKRNVHATDLETAIAVVADLGRLARFRRLPEPAGDELTPWLHHAARDVAWCDLAFRRVRRKLDEVPAWLADPAQRVLDQWLVRRDALNAAFADRLASQWSVAARNTDARQPLALHQLSRCLIRRLVDDGSRVLLLVLDGCDLASFVELVGSLPADRRIGLALPEVRDATLRDDLTASSAWTVAISPIPTVTNHARRALFAGEIPGNTSLDDTESAAANASADRVAWERNTALGATPRRLFLKGDLGGSGQPLHEALRTKAVDLIAAVYNGVDDALSSKETTPSPEWSFAGLGAGALETIDVAIREGWCVLVTADHGHTPFVETSRKVAPSALGQRFSAEPHDGTVAFANGPLPRQPLHLLTRTGAWFGTQRRGFHGGASIEEVVVPLAFLGRVRGELEGRPKAPSWWWSDDAPPPPTPEPVRVLPAPPPVVAAPPGVNLDPRLDGLADDERRILMLLAANQSARLSVVAQHLGKAPVRASGFMQQLIRKLFDLGVPCIVVDGLADGDRMYRYVSQDPGSR